jgi:hypothetical protein
MKMKVVLRNGSVEEGQGIIEADSFDDMHILKWNGNYYRFNQNKYENKIMVILYDACPEPYEVHEF